MPYHRHRPPGLMRLIRPDRLWLFLFGITLAHAAGEGGSKVFNVVADNAERSLKAFSEQAGCGVIFVTDAVKGLRTNPVKGNFTPSEALDILLHNTGLVGSSDAATGAFAVRRATPAEPKNVQRAAQMTAGDRPTRQNQPSISKIHLKS